MKKIITKNTNSFFLLLLLCLLLSTSCTNETEETVNKTTTLLANTKKLMVEKTNKDTKSIGVFSGSNYGNTHKFTYSIKIDNDASWYGGSKEPTNIIFCKDSIYLRSLKKTSVSTDTLDIETNETLTVTNTEIQEVFEKYIDKRYFFKLFGDDYWSDITAHEYELKNSTCVEFEVPNENELAEPTTKNLAQ